MRRVILPLVLNRLNLRFLIFLIDEMPSERFEKGSDGILFKPVYLRCNTAHEEAVGLVSGGIEAQVFAGIQIDLQVLQQFGAVDGFKFGMFGQETFDLQFVFFRQHAAGGVNQTALRFRPVWRRHRGYCVAVPKVWRRSRRIGGI